MSENTLPDLSNVALWAEIRARRERATAESKAREDAAWAEREVHWMVKQQSQIARQIKTALENGETWISYWPGRLAADDYLHNTSEITYSMRNYEAFIKLRDWVRAQPGYWCKLRSKYGAEYELSITFRIFDGRVDIRRPPFWIRWFC